MIGLLENLNSEDVDRAKRMTKVNVEQTIERTRTRLEDNLRALLVYDGLVHTEYLNMVDRVTVESVRDLLSRLLASKPTLVVRGNVSSVPT